MSQRRRAYSFALTVVLLWSTAGSAFKLSLRYVDVLQLLFCASIVSVAVLFLILLLQRKIRLLKSCSRADLLKSAALGFLNPFLYYCVLLKAYALLPAQEAMVLNYTWPIVLVVLSVPLLKRKITGGSLVFMFVSFTGVAIVATRGDLSHFQVSHPLGAFLALLSTVVWAVYWICNTGDKQDAVVRLFLNMCFGFAFVALASAFGPGFDIPGIAGLLGAAYVGAFEMGVTFVLWLTALRLSQAAAGISNLIFLSPILSLFWIRLLIGEDLRASTIVGLAFVLAGIALQRTQGTRQQERAHRAACRGV